MEKYVEESIKEFARVCILATLPVLIVSFEQQEFDYKATSFALIVALLRAADSYIHHSKTGIFKNVNGISPI